MDELNEYLGKPIVVDTRTSFIYIGMLKELGEFFMTLSDVDVHDCAESQTTKEVYVLEARKFGIHKNRSLVKVRMDHIVSISLLDDVIPY